MAVLFLAIAATAVPAIAAEQTTELYHTDFSNFPAGDGKLVGQDGWESTHPDEIVHGTVDDRFQQGNRSASLGFLVPDTSDKIISVYRPINYDPVASKTPVIEFSASVAIFDSFDTVFYDSFYISVFNSNADLLASIVFDNTEENFGIWRADGDGFYDTSVTFEHSKLYQLRLRIDFANNRWTAALDDTELFTDAPFSNSAANLELGDFSAEWEISDVSNPGDNWMLFDNWTVNAIGEEEPFSAPMRVKIKRLPNGDVSLLWNAQPSTRYQVETSSDCETWDTSLQGSQVTTGVEEHVGSLTDRSAPSAGVRYYRVRRQLP